MAKKPTEHSDLPLIATRLKDAREALGLSQSDLAGRVGMKQTGIGSIEAGESRRPRKLLELARAVNKTPEWLLGENAASIAGMEPAATGTGDPFEQFALLPRYAVDASAGPGLIVDKESIEGIMRVSEQLTLVNRFMDRAPVDVETLAMALGAPVHHRP